MIVALTDHTIGYRVIVALTGLPTGYSIIVALSFTIANTLESREISEVRLGNISIYCQYREIRFMQ